MRSMKKLEFLTKLGPKSQIVLRKEMRVALGLEPGSMVKLRRVNNKIILKPVKKEEIIAEVERIAKMIGKKWPKGLSAVEAIRQERE